jgi:hypothetical protein
VMRIQPCGQEFSLEDAATAVATSSCTWKMMSRS